MTDKTNIHDFLPFEAQEYKPFQWKIAVTELFNEEKFSSSHNMKLLWAKNVISALPEEPEFSDYWLYFQALAFLGRYSEGLEQLKKLTFSVKKEVNIHQMMIMNFKSLLGKPSSLKVNELSEFCKNRDIIILGPKKKGGVPRTGNSLFVRFNVTTEDQAKDCDIVYYNKYNFIKYKKEIITLIAEYDFKVVVNGFVPSRDGVDIPSYLLSKIFSNSPFLLCFNSALLAVPRCVNDMLSYGVKSVFILGVDLFTSYPFHSAGYNASVTGISKVINSWAIHDIFFNFNLLQRFYELNLINGDNFFKAIIQEDLESYFSSIAECVNKTKELDKD